MLFPYPGQSNTFSAPSVVAGGDRNIASGILSIVGGGSRNDAEGNFSIAAGGDVNVARGNVSTVSGGADNFASGAAVAVSGGALNTAGLYGVVGGGYANIAFGTGEVISGGRLNRAQGSYATVAGGYDNCAVQSFSLAAGRGVRSTHRGAFVWGDSQDVIKTSSTEDQFNIYAVTTGSDVGIGTTAPAQLLSVNGDAGKPGGGAGNSAFAAFATVGGGFFNSASGFDATVGGGAYNTASGTGATVGGGANNTALGMFSFAAGRRAIANHDGAFVWGDSSFVDKTSSTADEFNIYAEGGMRMFADGQATPSMVVDTNGDIGIGTTAPAQLLSVNGDAGKPGGGSWSVFSDRRLKKSVEDLDGALETLLDLRGVSFEYKDAAAIGELEGERRGFIAQEVEGVLPDWVEDTETGYKQLTIRGFEAFAVEGLRELNDRRDAEIAKKDAEIAALRDELGSLKNEFASLKAMVATD